MGKKITAFLVVAIMIVGFSLPVFGQAEDVPENNDEVVAESTAETASASDTENVDDVSENDDVTVLEMADEDTKPEETSSGIPTYHQSPSDRNVNEKTTFIETLKLNFEKTFIRDSRWKLFLEGFLNTVIIALCSTVLGVLIGMVIAVVKVLHAQIDRPNIFVNIFNFIFNTYTTVIRGTPAVVQLFIAYYIIFVNTDNYILVSIFAFGINSGAYVSEIVRGGIMSIDRGQLEAGRSLGLSYITTMVSIVLPQAIKNILPALGNEFILLLKDTSIAGYIGTLELMKAGNIVRSRTFEPYFSLLSVAAIYLVCVIGLEQLIKYFERRMAKSDRH